MGKDIRYATLAEGEGPCAQLHSVVYCSFEVYACYYIFNINVVSF